LTSYVSLLYVPALCAPLQNLYITAGQRYDLGAITYIAGGALTAAILSDSGARRELLPLLMILVALSVTSYVLRCLILSIGSPKDFTLFTFGQTWAVPAIIGYEIEHRAVTGTTGVYVNSLERYSLVVIIVVTVLSLLFTVVLARTSLTLRLTLLTENSEQYCLTFGSPWALALRIESLAFASYFLAGVAFRFALSDISADVFGTESLWSLLAASIVPGKWRLFVICGPFAATAIRFLINQSSVDSKYDLLLVYVLIGACLAVLNVNAKRVCREAVS